MSLPATKVKRVRPPSDPFRIWELNLSLSLLPFNTHLCLSITCQKLGKLTDYMSLVAKWGYYFYLNSYVLDCSGNASEETHLQEVPWLLSEPSLEQLPLAFSTVTVTHESLCTLKVNGLIGLHITNHPYQMIRHVLSQVTSVITVRLYLPKCSQPQRGHK